MNIPSVEEAEKILKDAEIRNPGLWVGHSEVTAQCARKIAKRCKNINEDAAYVLGLLHDIGRRFGVSYFKHISDGYFYMNELGYEDVARICLTHSFQFQDINSYIGEYDIAYEVKLQMENKLNSIKYNDYDYLIQLCDCLALAEGVVLIEKRLVDVVLRYGAGNLIVEKWKAIFDLKEYFENKIGENIYKVITDDETLWGK